MSEPKVMIIIPTQEFARRADFYDYMDQLHRPEGTATIRPHGQSPARNRNMAIEQAMNDGFTHCFFVDDDCILRPDALLRLLAHDKDMVGGLYLMRDYPHLPIMFDASYNDGRCKYSFLETGKNGLVETVNTGLGCMLIKMEVFKAMEKPWIRLGQLEKDHWCDDIDFFNRARNDYNFKLYVDMNVQVGHILTASVFPHRAEDGTWHTAFSTKPGEAFTLPQYIMPEDEVARQIAELGVVETAKT